MVKLKAWLMTICVNNCRNLAKKKKFFNFSSFQESDEDRPFEESIVEKSLGPKQKAIQLESVERVQRAIKQLPKKYQVVIHLRYVQDLSYNEIGEVLQLPLNTVKVHINRAKKALKAHL